MAGESNRETRETRYLLGTLSQEDESRLEEAYFEDDAKFEGLEIAEAELIDAYIQQELSPAAQQRFEANLRASPRMLEQVKFARLLNARASDSFSPDQEVSRQPTYLAAEARRVSWWEGLVAHPAFRVALAAGVFVILAGGVALFIGWRSLRNESNKLASERAALEQQKRKRDESTNQQTNADQLPTNLQPEREQQANDQRAIKETADRPILGAVTQFLLTPGSSLRGGGGGKEFPLGADISTVQLKLLLENNNYRSYSVTIESGAGKAIKRANGLKARTIASVHYLILSVPASLLSPGDYIVDVNGRTSSGQFESVSNYAFRVAK